MYPSISYCYTFLSKESRSINCGAYYIYHSQYNNLDYFSATFYFSGVSANLKFEIRDYGQRPDTFCFVNPDSNQFTQINTLTYLYESKQIKQGIIYFSLNCSKPENGFIGQIDLGAHNKDFTKKGIKFAKINPIFDEQGYYGQVKVDINFFGQKLNGPIRILFTIKFFYLFTAKNFKSIVQIFDQNGIQYTYQEEISYNVFLTSIEKLQSFELTLIQEGCYRFPITIKPSSYTQLIDNCYTNC